jgi:tetratricopeptide (TPR) repeat protein
MAKFSGPHKPQADQDAQTVIDHLIRGSAPNSLETLQSLQTLCLEAEAHNDLPAALLYNEAGSEFIEIAPPSFKAAEITFQLTKGRLLFKSGRLEEAADALREALEVSAQMNFLSEDHRNLTCYQACHILAGVRHKQGNLSEAHKLLSLAYSFGSKRFGADSVEAIGALLEMAQSSAEHVGAFKTFLSNALACKRALLGRNQMTDEQTAAMALDLGSLYYEQGIWDEAGVLLQASSELSKDILRKTKALLSLAHISFHQTETTEASKYLDEAMALWMDRAFPPHLDRHMSNLRALVAQAQGDESSYLQHLQQACHVEPGEDLSFESLVDLHCRRATFLRLKGFHEEAVMEISQAEMLVSRGIVSPLQRFKFHLEQSYVHFHDEEFDTSIGCIDRALSEVEDSGQRNPILLARAYALRAYNRHGQALETSEHSVAQERRKQVLEDGQKALKLLNPSDTEHSLQKQLLRLLIETCEESRIKKPLASLEARLNRILFRFPD